MDTTGSWSTFLTAPAAFAESGEAAAAASNGVPPYSSAANAPATQNLGPSSNSFERFTYHQSQSSRVHAMQQLEQAARTAPNTPQPVRKRTREDADGGLTAAMQGGGVHLLGQSNSHSMFDPPQLHRMTSLDMERKYDQPNVAQVMTQQQAPPNKKQCQQRLSVHIDPLAHSPALAPPMMAHPASAHSADPPSHLPSQMHSHMSPFTPQISSMSLSSHTSTLPPFPFHSGAHPMPPAQAADHFRPSSAPIHRPTMSILTHHAQPFGDALAMDDLDGCAAPHSSPPTSPIDATIDYEHVQHPSTPSRHSSSYSMPGLHRMPSSDAGSGSTTSHGQFSLTSSLQSSYAASPADASRSAAAGQFPLFRPSSPSIEIRAAQPRPNMHTPGVEIGVGVLYMNHCAPQTAHVAPATFTHTFGADARTGMDDVSGMED